MGLHVQADPPAAAVCTEVSLNADASETTTSLLN